MTSSSFGYYTCPRCHETTVVHNFSPHKDEFICMRGICGWLGREEDIFRDLRSCIKRALKTEKECISK